MTVRLLMTSILVEKFASAVIHNRSVKTV